MRAVPIVVVCFLAALPSLFGQSPAAAPSPPSLANIVPNERLYARIIAVVPMVGTGKPDDPIRPMFTLPVQQLIALTPGKDGRPSGIMASHYVLSDDNKSALVEYIEADRATLAPLLNSTDPRVKVFERGVHDKKVIEAEFQKVKAGFTIESLSPARIAPTLIRTITPGRAQ